MLKLYIDIRQTRRKRFNHVLDEADTVLFSAQAVEPCIRFLEEKGHLRFKVVGENAAWEAELTPIDA